MGLLSLVVAVEWAEIEIAGVFDGGGVEFVSVEEICIFSAFAWDTRPCKQRRTVNYNSSEVE